MDYENSDLFDEIDSAAVVLGGIADALSMRSAVYADDMLEMIAYAANNQANALRSLLETWETLRD
ncbi:MAG: hypothetical protein IJ087_01050 [Eggerthellaceae bacterium]|nr:hypothetical protein [Eggerthellaceae bacterium]